MEFFPDGILSSGIFVLWDFCPLGFCPHWIFSSGIFTSWDFFLHEILSSWDFFQEPSRIGVSMLPRKLSHAFRATFLSIHVVWTQCARGVKKYLLGFNKSTV